MDMSIIRNVHTDRGKNKLLTLMCDFADATNAMIVAEGMKVEEELIALQEVWRTLTARVLFCETIIGYRANFYDHESGLVSVMNTLIAGSSAYKTRIGKPCAVTIGRYDGVHLGHSLLLMRTIEEAQTKGIYICIYI